MRLLEESETEMHPRYERLCQEMIALTVLSRAPYRRQPRAPLFRNKQQIQSDLRWWQGILKVSGLTLSVGRQITVEGPEWTIRGFVMSMLFSFSSAAVRRRILPSLFGSIEPTTASFWSAASPRCSATSASSSPATRNGSSACTSALW